jgi:bacteriocin biosynthesis cyclodehydratase domain-containing protein
VGGPLRFKGHLVTEFVPSEGLFVLSEAGERVFRGPVFARVAESIDGERSDDEIATSLAGEIPPATVYYAIATLRRAGVLVEKISPFGPSETAFWDALALDPTTVEPPRVALVGVGEVELGVFEARLRDLGVVVDPEAERTLVLCDDYLRSELDAIDERVRSSGRGWLLAKPLGLGPWIGPLFRPDRPGCWACLAHRLRGHRRVQRFLQDHTGRTEPYPTAHAALPATLTAVAGLLATQLETWVNPPDAADEHPLERAVISLDPRALTSTRHPLTARPQCPRCGDPGMVARRQLQPITIEPKPAALRDGGRRSEDPHTTFERLEHHISPITGIVSRMVRSSPPDSEVAHSYYTDHNFVHMTSNLEFLRVSLRSYSGGKGRSEIQAKTGALCESIERYSSVFQGDEAMHVASYAQLRERGEPVVHPNDMMLYSEMQLAERERWNATGELFSWVPQPFDEHAQIPWTPAWSLDEEGEASKRWVASSLCFYDAVSPMMRADSNGSAAGSNLEEAIVQGFMELVERDAVALWWYNRLRLPRVDLASFDQPYFERVVAEAADNGRELWVLELPTDIAVPCFVAVSRRVDQSAEEIIFGLGAHLDASLAVSRAITEHNQFLPHVSTSPGGPAPTSVAARWYLEAKIATEPYLAPSEDLPVRRRDDFPRYDAGLDLRAEIERCVRLVRERGLDLLVQDHTRPDTSLSVAKVIVPGLRHFWARFAPGRLYQVPVELGLLARPTPERELNPVPIFI